MSGTVLVTGGAGYIGSHVVKQLGEAGRKVVILDNLSKGFRNAVLHGELIVGDAADIELVSNILTTANIDAVMHLAAHTVVPESVADPMKYYGNNTCTTRNLLTCCQRTGVKHFIFSSTAAVYGMPDGPVATEDTPTLPINPYGRSKLMSEYMLGDLANAGGPSFVILRYFNVAGCDPRGRIGQSTPDATLLIKVACKAALDPAASLAIFGTDYPTPDGTGVRNYIHVEDLAHVHLKALGYLEHGGESRIFNCGYGHGYSVREVLDMVAKVAGTTFSVREESRRPGDPPSLVAGTDRIRAELDWEPRYDDLEMIVRTALNWERHLFGNG